MLADVCIIGCFGRLSPAAVLSADCRFDSRGKWWIYVSSIIIYLCKNSFLLHGNSCKQCSESSARCCFWLTVSKYDTHFKHSFLIDKCSCKMVNTLPSGIFNSSAISCNFNLWSAKMSLWSVFGVFQDNCRIWVTWAFSTICVCTTTFKPLFSIDRVRIMLYQLMKLRFFLCFENLQQ